jgi:hypothetical protein
LQKWKRNPGNRGQLTTRRLAKVTLR